MRKLLVAVACLVGAGGGSAGAQVYPARALTMVPFAAGGPHGAIARTLAECMQVALGPPVMIENIDGSAGVGTGRLAGAKVLDFARE